ncbi:3'-5' exonuclease [Priestia aryabhattai]|uniref:3'-5' exonuclease n=1 Tax=Priestia aryabhattai TaxID=412384 RepID=UPI0024532FCD|nr:3'-5' exonuclease [Priestia aryabhattai]MDH3111318.1 3'-5' exonuclease [Priestia aryabhattai]MDH3129858.1 3'-5' exonuclease [Priestia aryabhattai]
MSLPTPEGLQCEVLALPEIGHYVVLGTAGSGKTTLAILRAVYLSRLHKEKVLIVTFNKALVTYLKSISEGELKNVDVHNYHKFARGYLGNRGLLGPNDIVRSYSTTKWTKSELIQKALEKRKEINPTEKTFERPLEVFIEEINWIQKMGIKNSDDYNQADRIGRGSTRISRDKRAFFFEVYQEYLEIRKDYNYKYDLEDIPQYVSAEFDNDNGSRMYKHIIIDEGQDLSPIMLQSLSKAIPEDGSITYFGDVAQQIYGSRISWRHAGFNNPKVWKFEQNYRNTKEIASLALAISNSSLFKEDVDLIEPKAPKASGPKPAVIKFTNNKSEINAIIKQAEHFSKNETVAILVRDRETVSTLKRNLRAKDIDSYELNGEMNRWHIEPSIHVGTLHSAKGLEFDIVIIPFCNNETLPSSKRILSLDSEDEAKSEEIKLLYVGVTRAKRGLIITFTGEATELLPPNNDLYQEFER